MILRDKNKRWSAGLFLAFYTFFIFFAAMHTHSGAAYTESRTILISAVNSDRVIDPFLDENSNCRLIQFGGGGKIVIARYSALSPLIKSDLKFRPSDSAYYLSEHLRNSDLRAPPFSS